MRKNKRKPPARPKPMTVRNIFVQALKEMCSQHIMVKTFSVDLQMTGIFVEIVLHGEPPLRKTFIPIDTIPNYLAAPIDCLAEQIVEQMVCGSKSDDEEDSDE